jgi:hypothetical protein
MQVALGLALIAGLLATAVSVALKFAGLPVDRLALGSAGVVGTSTGLLFIGEAVMSRWERARWKPPPCRPATVRLGRLSTLAFGIWFGALGMTFLTACVLNDLPNGAGWALLGALATAAALVTAGMRFDGRSAQAAEAAVRTRGWLMASRRADDDLPPDEAQRRQDARAGLEWSIQRHVTAWTTLERAEAYIAAAATSLNGWPEVAEQWLGFRSAFEQDDLIWEFSTVSTRLGTARGEEGFARVRRGTVVDWFITAVVG